MVFSSVITFTHLSALRIDSRGTFWKNEVFLYGGSSFMCRNLYFALYLGFVFYVQIGIALFSSLMGLFRTKGCPLVCLYSYVLKNAPGAFKRKIWRNIIFLLKYHKNIWHLAPNVKLLAERQTDCQFYGKSW